jgi:hypothetical protein
MKINVKDITNGGTYLNKDVWVCDLRFNNCLEKPIRKVEPIKVSVQNTALVKKTIYYSDNALVPYNKKGELNFNQAFGIYDNTGFRSYPGVPLEIFDSEKECVERYKILAQDAIEGLEIAKKSMIDIVDERINKLRAECN